MAATRIDSLRVESTSFVNSAENGLESRSFMVTSRESAGGQFV
jgi:hypothetical protein